MGSELVISRYFGYWLLQQILILHKPSSYRIVSFYVPNYAYVAADI